MKSRTWAEIDLSAIRHNFGLVRSLVGFRTEVMPVVKAEAYGHGMLEIAQALVTVGADWLCVATVEEGVALRESLQTTAICVLSPPLPHDSEDVLLSRLVPFISNMDQARALAQAAQTLKLGINVHIEVDTGMGRSGALPDEARRIAEQISRLPSIVVSGLATHFPSAESDPIATASQLAVFQRTKEAIEAADTRLSILHTANSAALLQYSAARLSAVRPGLLIYGIVPALSQTIDIPDFRPALSLKSTIALVRDMPEGSAISYQGTHVLKRPSRVATIPVGYGDGYPRELSNKGSVLIGRRRAPIIGRVCMDMTMIDVTDIPDAVPGAEVVLIGGQGSQRIRAEDLARTIGTTEHDITTRLTPRVPRVYLNAKERATYEPGVGTNTREPKLR